MKKIENYEAVQASSGEFAKPTAGGYICKIIDVKDVPIDESTGKGDYLRIEYDIANGEFEGYYKEQFDRWGGNWIASFIRSYKEKALGMFKQFTNCVENSNKGFEWDWNESELIGKKIGLVLGEEEYRNASGFVKIKLVVKDVKPVSDIESGNFRIPALKKLEDTSGVTAFSAPTNFSSVDDEDEFLPF